MVNYVDGKIYKIISANTDLIYYGSTAKKTLAQRMTQHRSDYQKYLTGKRNFSSAYSIMEQGDYQIILVETYPCLNRDELHAREQYWIEQTPCVNIKKAICSAEERVIDRKVATKKYRDNNREKIKKINRDYKENNKEKVKEYFTKNKERLYKINKEYYHENKESINEKIKKYRQENLDIVREKDNLRYHKNRKAKVQCGCGSVVSKHSLCYHKKSIKHQVWEKEEYVDIIFVE